MPPPVITTVPLRPSVLAVIVSVSVVSTSLSLARTSTAVAGALRPTLSESSVTTGTSLTGVTSMVIVFGLWSRSTPPLAVPPLSRTWNVKVA